MRKVRPLRESAARRRAEVRAQRRAADRTRRLAHRLVAAVFAFGLVIGVAMGVVLGLYASSPPGPQVADTLSAPAPQDPQQALPDALAPQIEPRPEGSSTSVASANLEPEVLLGSEEPLHESGEEPSTQVYPPVSTAVDDLAQEAVSSEAMDAAAAVSLQPPSAPQPPELALDHSLDASFDETIEPAEPGGDSLLAWSGAEAPAETVASPPVRAQTVETPAGRVHMIYEEEPVLAQGGITQDREAVNLAVLVDRARESSVSSHETGYHRHDVEEIPMSPPQVLDHETAVETPGAVGTPGAMGTSGQERWRDNAVAVSVPAGRPMIAVVIDDLGLNRPNTRRTIALQAPLTLAFMTYAEGLERMTRQARAAGHELLVHVPMEPLDGTLDPGRNVLLAGAAGEEIRRRLTWGLARFSGYVGINNHMGSRFTANPQGMEIVLAELKRRGLLYLDSKTAVASVGSGLAGRLGVPFVTRDIFLDNNPEDRASIRRQLRQLENLARRRGAAVGIGHPHRSTIEELGPWLAGLEDRGFTLVPISALVQRRVRLAEELDSSG